MVPSKTSHSILQFSNDLTEKSEAIIASALSTSEVTQKLTQGLFPLFLTTSIIFSKKKKDLFKKLNNLLYNYTCWKTLYLVYFGIKKNYSAYFLFLLVFVISFIHYVNPKSSRINITSTQLFIVFWYHSMLHYINSFW